MVSELWQCSNATALADSITRTLAADLLLPEVTHAAQCSYKSTYPSLSATVLALFIPNQNFS